jgi:hypothetical protein
LRGSRRWPIRKKLRSIAVSEMVCHCPGYAKCPAAHLRCAKEWGKRCKNLRKVFSKAFSILVNITKYDA